MDQMLTNIYFYIPWVTSSIGLIFSAILCVWILKQYQDQNRENHKGQEISKIIEHCSMTFLKREYSLLSLFLLFVSLLLLWKLGLGTTLSYLAGALFSILCAVIGLKMAARTNIKTTKSAQKGLREAFILATQGSAVIGISVAALGLMGITGLYSWVSSKGMGIAELNGFAMGASSIALFARMGGGIFTKACDIGGDVVGRLEANIPEDDPRNPASVAGGVGDMIGGTVGMGADIFESYVAAIISTIFIASSYSEQGLMILPLLIVGAGLLSSMLSLFSLKIFKTLDLSILIRVMPVVATTLLIIFSFIIVRSFAFISFPYTMGPFYAILIGAVSGLLMGFIAEYYTSISFFPVKSIARAGRAGVATNAIAGIAYGLYATIAPILTLCFTLFLAYHFCDNYGVGLAAVGMLATTGIRMTLDSYRSISDMSDCIAQTATLGTPICEVTSKLDTLGSGIVSMGKGFAVGSAALTSFALFSAYVKAVNLPAVNLNDFGVVMGLLLGSVVPFFCAASIINSVGKTAQRVVEEVRRQFKDIPGIIRGSESPDHERCLMVATEGALFEMMVPGFLVVIIPLLVGFIFGKAVLGGFIIGVIVSGLLLELFMEGSGGAWDSAKRAIELGVMPGDEKGSLAHKAALNGDAIGDPFKDAAGPSMNIIVKLIAMIALVIAPLI